MEFGHTVNCVADVPALVEVFKSMCYEIKVWPSVRRLCPALLHDLNVVGWSGTWWHWRTTQRRRLSHLLHYIWHRK